MEIGERVIIDGHEVGLLQRHNLDGTADVVVTQRTMIPFQKSTFHPGTTIRLSLWNPAGSLMVWENREFTK